MKDSIKKERPICVCVRLCFDVDFFRHRFILSLFQSVQLSNAPVVFPTLMFDVQTLAFRSTKSFGSVAVHKCSSDERQRWVQYKGVPFSMYFSWMFYKICLGHSPMSIILSCINCFKVHNNNHAYSIAQNFNADRSNVFNHTLVGNCQLYIFFTIWL